MPQPDQDTSRAPWRGIEWLISSGLALTLAAAMIWVGTIDERVMIIRDEISKLDNYTLGNRITALEVALKHADIQQDRVERKIDRLLERNVYIDNGTSPQSARGPGPR